MSAKVFFLSFLLFSACLSVFAQGSRKTTAQPSLRVAEVRCEGFADPLGIDVAAPRLSWILESGARSQSQSAYQILVASSRDLLQKDSSDRWNSGKVQSGQSIQVAYSGTSLESGRAYYWKVRLWDRNGKPSDWSSVATWSMGLLKPDDWKGKWVGLDGVDTTYHLTGTQWIWFPGGRPEKSAPLGTRYFRRMVVLPEGRTVQRALLHGTADDEGVFFLNGAPICTSMSHHTLVELKSVKGLRVGRNLLAVAVRNAAIPNSGDSPNPAGLVGMFEVRFTDGTILQVPTDSMWKTTDTFVAGWQSIDFDDAGWVQAQTLGPVGMSPWGNKSGLADRRLAARWLRKEFILDRPIRRATVYMSGLGLSELYVNGKKIGDHVLSPALSEYPKRVFYVAHDVSSYLTPGQNTLGVVLGNGRYYAPRLGEPTTTQTYGYPKLLLQLHIENEDGTIADVVSDETWRLSTDGPILVNNEYDGEEYDARKELEGWSDHGFNDARWQRVEVVSPPGGVLSAQMVKPIRVVESLKPISVTEARPGAFIFDMGQNMVGWCRVRVRGPRETQISLRHAETLKPDGVLYLDNLRGAKVTDLYTLKGGGEEVYEPRFTYHGFRFVEMQGYPGRPDLSTIEGRVVNDDVEPAGEFTCSNPVINKIYRSIVRGVQGNYRSIPTDCPQRDERQGWLGDRSAESRGESYLFDISALYAKWVQDMADGQMSNGSVSDVCPSYWPLYNDNVTWPSSTVIIPGALLDQYADSALIRSHYPSMVKWIDHMSGFIKDDVLEKDTYGDWCVPPESPELIHSNDPLRKTAPGILSTSYFYHDLQLMSRYATIVGNRSDADRFAAVALRLKEGLNRRYYNDTLGYYDNGSQTSCVLPLFFDMVPVKLRERVFDRLVRKITEECKGHIGTGLVGGQWLNRVLTDFGRADLVYGFATNTTYPSWGYMMEKGATTVWELWNGDSADPGMNSGNHVMLIGDLVIWLYEHLAGIKADPQNPGFKHVVMRPTPVGDLQSVKATHRSPHGLIESEWKNSAGRFVWNIRVPVNATATVYVPSKSVKDITESGKPIRNTEGVKYMRMEGSFAVFEVQSGAYRFASRLPR